jgi:hypothetical protein
LATELTGSSSSDAVSDCKLRTIARDVGNFPWQSDCQEIGFREYLRGGTAFTVLESGATDATNLHHGFD